MSEGVPQELERRLEMKAEDRSQKPLSDELDLILRGSGQPLGKCKQWSDIRFPFDKDHFGYRVMDVLGWAQGTTGVGGGTVRARMVTVGMWNFVDGIERCQSVTGNGQGWWVEGLGEMEMSSSVGRRAAFGFRCWVYGMCLGRWCQAVGCMGGLRREVWAPGKMRTAEG